VVGISVNTHIEEANGTHTMVGISVNTHIERRVWQKSNQTETNRDKQRQTEKLMSLSHTFVGLPVFSFLSLSFPFIPDTTHTYPPAYLYTHHTNHDDKPRIQTNAPALSR
jgi:hypothetical protein